MDCEMQNIDDSNNKEVTDKSIDVQWQIDSEWINLSSSPSLALPLNKKKGKKNKPDLADPETEAPPNFHFISAVKGGRFLVVDNKALRLSQKKATGYSYWVCSIPCCTARCVLDPEEKKIVRFCRDHNHEAEVSRQEYKKFINALKISVKENPLVKPKFLYDVELERAKERWRENNVKNNTNEEEPCLPSFDAVRTAMYNSRNAVLSAVSLKATDDERVATEGESTPLTGPSRSTRSRDAKAGLKRKSALSNTLVQTSNHLDELKYDDESDEDWKDLPSSKSDVKQNSEDVNFYFMPSTRGCQVLVIDGCLLHQNTVRTSGKSYWRCQKKGCFFRAVYDPRVDQLTKTTGLHNHPPDSNQMMRRQFINNVKYQIIEHPHVPARQIYEKEVHKVQQELEELGVIWKIPSFSCVKHHAYRARRIATKNEDDEEEDDDVSEEQPIKRDITETEKKFLEETALLPHEEETGLNISLLSPGPSLIQSKNFPDLSFYFIPSKKGKRILVVNDFTLRLNSLKSGGRYYWKCTVDPCMFRCVYNENLKDLVKVSSKHTHTSNVNRLRMREFCFLMKACMAEDPSLTPKKAYDQEVAKIRNLENGETLLKCLPAYSSIRTSLYNQKHKRVVEDEQGLQPGSSAGINDGNNYYMGSSANDSFTDCSHSDINIDHNQDISPKDITHLSLEDNDPMEHEDDDRGSSLGNSSSSNLMEITAPSLYDNDDIIDQYCNLSDKEKSATQGEINNANTVIMMPDPSVYSLSFVPTTRGGRALVVNGCVLRISYTRDYVTYWRCLNNDCSFRCSYDGKEKHLLRISGEHNHSVNRYSPIIRTFVRKIKKRVCQENDLSPRIIYDEELHCLKGDGNDTELLKKLPSYDSLKSALYKVKNRSSRAGTSIEEPVDYLLEESENEKDDESSTDASYSCSTEDPPYDACIEEGFSVFSAQLPFWLEQHPDKRLLDGHLLVKKSASETSTGWACTKDDCPFRCVMDNETSAITRSQWGHTHKSVVKQTISQAMFNAVKRRAVMDTSILPKLIYEQERKRITDKLLGSKILTKFIPNLTQVYQLVTKTRTNPPPPPKPKIVRMKLPKQQKKSPKPLRSNNTGSSSSNVNYVEPGQFDYLLDHCEDNRARVNAYIDDHQQQRSLIYKKNPEHILPAPCYNPASYQQTDLHVSSSYINSVQPISSSTVHTSTFTSVEQPTVVSTFSPLPKQHSHYIPEQCMHQQQQELSQPLQQQPSPITISAPVPQQSSPIMTVTEQQLPSTLDSQSMVQIPQALTPSNENVFTLKGYQLLPTMTNDSNIYWQCHTPECRFQCVFNVDTSQIVQITDHHNHEPPCSQSDLCSQVIKILQRKSVENAEKPLSSVYWEYMESLRNVLASDEIMNGLPRFQDVALAMQNSRSTVGIDDSSQQLHNLIVGNATHASRVYEFHFDAQCRALVVDGSLLVNSWKMNEISYWRCKTTDCGFKCAFDEELQCVHMLNTHTFPCSSCPEGGSVNWAIKRKCLDKHSPRRIKIQRIE